MRFFMCGIMYILSANAGVTGTWFDTMEYHWSSYARESITSGRIKASTNHSVLILSGRLCQFGFFLAASGHFPV